MYVCACWVRREGGVGEGKKMNDTVNRTICKDLVNLGKRDREFPVLLRLWQDR